MKINDIVSIIKPQLSGCDESLIASETIRAIRRFAAESGSLIRVEEMTLEDAIHVELSPLNECDPFHIITAEVNEKTEPCFISGINAEFEHNVSGKARIAYSCIPKSNAENIPDDWGGRCTNGICALVVMTLCAYPGKPYSNPGIAQFNHAEYRRAIASEIAGCGSEFNIKHDTVDISFGRIW